MKSRIVLLIGVLFVVIGAFAFFAHSKGAKAEVNIFASPIQAGCYIAAPRDCRLHVDPFTINIASGEKLVLFKLVSIQVGPGTQRVIYDFRTDQSDPPPPSGTTYTPSLVTQDFAATCGQQYMISLQGQDTGDTGIFNLGLTDAFTCPSTAP
jgi:hypothetical protein